MTKYGDWTTIAGPFIDEGLSRTVYLCRCKCGTERIVPENRLKNGGSANCGCRRREFLIHRNQQRTGGVWADHLRAAHAWYRMIRRCYDPKANGFKNYGGRGITVCDEWRGDNGLRCFIQNMGDPPEGMSLGRKDNDAPYSLSNCRWETDEEQRSNTRRSVHGFLRGVKMTAAQIGRIVGQHSSVIAKQIKRGLYAE